MSERLEKMKNPNLFSLLSDDLIEEIFLRAPAKPLHRAKCVCKVWRLLISSPSFVYRVTARSNSLPPLLTGFFCSNTDREDAPPYHGTAHVNLHGFGRDLPMDANSQMDTHLSFLQLSVVAVACHKGLLLCSEFSPGGFFRQCLQYILCNPFTKEWITLPKVEVGHDISNVILFCYEKDQYMEFMVLAFIPGYSLFHKYCSEEGEWSLLRVPGLPPAHETFVSHFLFNGFIYMLDDRRHFCAYDLKEGSARLVQLPTASQQHRCPDACLGVSSGILYYAETDDISLSIWALLDGVEWGLTHRIESQSPVDELSNVYCFHPSNGNVLLVEQPANWGKKVLYHMDTRRLDVIDNFIGNPHFPVIPYSLPAWPPCLRNT